MGKEPVTIYISRRIKPGAGEALREWAEGVRATCAGFPGFLGGRTLEPHDNDDGRTFNIVFRFASFEQLRVWEESTERASWYARLQPLIEEERVSRLSGYEPWFPPGGTDSEISPPPPPVWKMFIMALMAVYPSVLLVRLLVGDHLDNLPLLLGVFLSCVPVSVIMSYLAMPGLTRVFRKWLYPSTRKED